jgi:CarD family transcriptional regulator
MMFKVGDKVFYPSQGPCRIGAVLKKTVLGEAVRFYPISSLDNIAHAVLIPIEKLAALPVRHLLAKSDIPRLLGHLNHSRSASKNWKQRALDNAKLFASGSPFDLAEIVESLTELGKTRELLPRDRQTLERARQFLICEISEVLEESRDTAKGQVDRALARKKMAQGNAASARLFLSPHEAAVSPENSCTRGT